MEILTVSLKSISVKFMKKKTQAILLFFKKDKLQLNFSSLASLMLLVTANVF